MGEMVMKHIFGLGFIAASAYASLKGKDSSSRIVRPNPASPEALSKFIATNGSNLFLYFIYHRPNSTRTQFTNALSLFLNSDIEITSGSFYPMIKRHLQKGWLESVGDKRKQTYFVPDSKLEEVKVKLQGFVESFREVEKFLYFTEKITARKNPVEVGDELFDSSMDVREIKKILNKQKIPYQSLKFDNIYTDSMYGQIENVFFLKKSGGMTADEQKRLRPELVRYFKQVYNTFASLEFEKSGSGVFIVALFGKKKPSAAKKNPNVRVQSHFKQVAIATFGVPPEHQDKVSVMFTTQGMTVSFNRIICDDFSNENLNRFMDDYSQYLENNYDGKWETSSTMRGNIVTINFIRAE